MEPDAAADIVIPASDVKLWRSILSHSFKEALEEINRQRMFPAEAGTLDMVWEIIKSGPHAMDRMAFESFVRQKRAEFVRSANKSAPDPRFPDRDTYYVQVTEPLGTVEKIRFFAGLPHRPLVVEWYTKDGEQCRSCLLTGEKFLVLYSLASVSYPNHKIRFFKEQFAYKNLLNYAVSPVLGEEYPEFMPQLAFPMHTPSPSSQNLVGDTWPLENEYPVWYFLYGRLTGAEWLNDIFKPQDDEEIKTFVAKAFGGRIDYRDADMVLVDPPLHYMVNGVAYMVETEVVEDALCAYTTSQFDVVRCYILLFGGQDLQMVKGCTFRLAQD